MLEIVTGVDIRYQGLFGRMSEMRAPAKGGHKGPTLVMRRFHSNRSKIVSYAKRRISKVSSLFKGLAATRDFRKDLPICGSQFESGYKSE